MVQLSVSDVETKRKPSNNRRPVPLPKEKKLGTNAVTRRRELQSTAEDLYGPSHDVRAKGDKLRERQFDIQTRQVITVLIGDAWSTAAFVAAKVKVNVATVSRAIRRLVKDGYVKEAILQDARPVGYTGRDRLTIVPIKTRAYFWVGNIEEKDEEKLK